MKTLILPLLLSLATPAVAAQPALGPQTALRQQHRMVAPSSFRHQHQQRVVVASPFRQQSQPVRNCGIGRWIDGVFTCQAGPVERALDRLNDTLERYYSDQTTIQVQQLVLQRAEAQRDQAMIEANWKAASDAAYVRAMTAIPPPPVLGPAAESTDIIYRRVASNGTITFSNVQ
jgi:hypothetical protein